MAALAGVTAPLGAGSRMRGPGGMIISAPGANRGTLTESRPECRGQGGELVPKPLRWSAMMVCLLSLAAVGCVSRPAPRNASGAPAASAPLGVTGTSVTTGPPACSLQATRIHAVQGAGEVSPLLGEIVTIQGVVVGDFQKGDGDEPFGTNLGGYAVQEQDAYVDDDPRTSEGIYVYDSRTDLGVGDLVRVTGRVTEYQGLTELTNVEEVVVCATGLPLPTPASITLPLADVAEWEAYEGMLVTFPQELVISEYFDFDRYGEILLAVPPPGASRPYQPTSRYAPGDPAVAELADYQTRARILLDDGRGTQNPYPPRHPDGTPFDLDNRFRGGDRLAGVTGILDFNAGRYRVQPTEGATYLIGNPRPDVPAVGGNVRVAAFNVENYFAGFGARCGPTQRAECRGAANAREFERQRAKTVAALAALDADVIALLEVENDPDERAIADLVSALNAAVAEPYTHVPTGPIGTDAIRVALVYRSGKVIPAGAPSVLDEQAFVNPRGAPLARNRPALAQTFGVMGSGGGFTVVVNHFKSKGSPCGRGDDDPVQGNCNLTRALAAERLVEWLATDPTGTGDPRVLVLGDLNAYASEDPVRTLLAGADGVVGTADDFTDLLSEFVGEEAYTYVYDGQVGYLDYALASSSLLERVTGVGVWHINADEPDIIGYRLSYKSAGLAALYAPDPFRSSDHDPVLVGLTFGDD